MQKQPGISGCVSRICLCVAHLGLGRMQSQKGKGKAFVYYYDHRTPASPDGANHAAEVSYVFGNFGGPGGGTPSPEDLALSDLIRSYWINFAKNRRSERIRSAAVACLYREGSEGTVL